MGSDYDGVLPAPVVPDSQQADGTAFYEKGAAVNRMFSDYLGQEQWFAVLKKHLHKYEWSNPELPNLLESFDADLPSGKQFAGFSKKMASWLEQPGMPLVTVSIVESSRSDGAEQRHPGKFALSVSQRPSSKKINQTQLWWVPLHVELSHRRAQAAPGAAGAGAGAASNRGGGKKKAADTVFAELDQHTQQMTIPLPKGYDAETTMLYGNFNFSAFVLVNYSDPNQWKNLIEKMAEPTFPIIDRQQLQKQLTFLAALENGTHSASLARLTELLELYAANLFGGLHAATGAAAAVAASEDYLLHVIDELALMGRQLLCLCREKHAEFAKGAGFTLPAQQEQFRAALATAFEMMAGGSQAAQVKVAALFWQEAFSKGAAGADAAAVLCAP